jgi:hypothetical protein
MPGQYQVRLEYFARLLEWRRLVSLAEAERLRGQHIWRDEVVAQRYDWGREKNIFALVLRVYRLPEPVELPVLESYGGCKSWIELVPDVAVAGAVPVLDDRQFSQKLAAFKQALGDA